MTRIDARIPRRLSTTIAIALAALGTACGTGSDQLSLHGEHTPGAPPAVDAPVFAGRRPSRQDAAAWFDAAGVQPGQPLPRLSLVDLEGRPVDATDLPRGRPLVLVTCSLTCNIARRQARAIADLQRRFGDAVAFAMVYTIDAHPTGDPCPYTGDEWVPPDNGNDGVLVRQPVTLEERRALARRYAEGWAAGVPVFVDTLDNTSWRALGGAPNVGLCVDANGTVVSRNGWCDPAKTAATLEGLLGR